MNYMAIVEEKCEWAASGLNTVVVPHDFKGPEEGAEYLLRNHIPGYIIQNPSGWYLTMHLRQLFHQN